MIDKIDNLVIAWIKSNSENSTLLAHQIIETLCSENFYGLIEWPYSQDYMSEDWFQEEAVLSDNSSYFIPLSRLL